MSERPKMDWPRELGTAMGDWPSFLDEAGPLPGLSGAADEARDRLVETFVKYIHTTFMIPQFKALK